jgi:hypothetical protein
MVIVAVLGFLFVVLDRVANRCGYPTHKPSTADPTQRGRTWQIVAVEIALGVLAVASTLIAVLRK